MAEPLAELTVDLDAIVANYLMLAERSAPARCAATVKADCYGLGLAGIAPALSAAGCDAFFVATLDEAVELRSLTPQAEIFSLNGLVGGDAGDFIAAAAVPVLNDPGQIEAWAAAARERGAALPAAIHLDTGINRLGLSPTQARALAESGAETLAAFDLKLVMSHLACGGQPMHPMNEQQNAAFDALRALFPAAPASMANSAGVLMGAAYHHNLTRPGIAIYGGSPFVDAPKLNEAVRLTAKILQVRDVASGESVGYDATWTAGHATRVAIAAIGYADGYLNGFDNRGHAVVGGRRVPAVGKVSMDLLALDVSGGGGENIVAGMDACLIGEGITLDEAAAAGGMTNYQLLTSVGRRVVRRYRQSEVNA